MDEDILIFLGLGTLFAVASSTTNQGEQPVLKSGLPPHPFIDAVTTNPDGSAASQLQQNINYNILAAPNASDAVIIGSAGQAALTGLDLTNAAQVAAIAPNPADQAAAAARLDAANTQIAALPQNTSPYSVDGVNPYNWAKSNYDQVLWLQWNDAHQVWLRDHAMGRA